ncbi:MAG: curli assembly protein CsgF [Desulfobacterota bacterium]|nr:curli assembly protein CsgF [Thermodesulfobacteriota bacterium]
MKRPHELILTIIVFCAALAAPVATTASELVYTPVNPSFGGSPLNGQWLLGYAGAQNKFKGNGYPGARREEKPFGLKLAEDVTRRAVSRIENEILNELFDNTRMSALDITSDYGSASGDALIYIEVNQYGDGNASSIDISY